MRRRLRPEQPPLPLPPIELKRLLGADDNQGFDIRQGRR